MGGDLSSRSVLVWHCGDTETFVFGFLYPGIWGCQKSESGGISWTLRMSKVWVWRHICDSEDVKSLSLEAYLWLWGCQKSESGGIYWTLRMSEVWVWRHNLDSEYVRSLSLEAYPGLWGCQKSESGGNLEVCYKDRAPVISA